MDIEDKYLPTIEEQKLFLSNRIAENKKQILGGKFEIITQKKLGNQNTVDQTEYMIKQLKENVDIYEEELNKLS